MWGAQCLLEVRRRFWVGSGRPSMLMLVPAERRSPRYHETCLALESVKESSAAVSKPRGVWLRMPIVKNLEEARRLPGTAGAMPRVLAVSQ